MMSKTTFMESFDRFWTDHWGERCSDSEPGCPNCIAWALRDTVDMILVEDEETLLD